MLHRIRYVVPRPCRLAFVLVAADVALFGLLRLAFHLRFTPGDGSPPLRALAEAFRIGAKFDLRVAILAALPLLILGGIGALSPFSGPRRLRAWTAYLTLAHLLVLFVYAVDFGHYAFAGSRVNVTVLQFLANLDTSARMVWETYPVLRGAIALAVAAAAIHRAAALLLARAAAAAPASAPLRQRAAASVAVGLLAACGIYGKLSWYPLRWSDAYFSANTYAANLAHNPVLYFAETLSKKTAPYDLAKVRASYPLIARYLGVNNPDPALPRYARRRPPIGTPPLRPNVVIVMLESFSAYKTGAFGNPLDPTPAFDTLARRGVLYTRHYTPNWGTARSVFATITGLPDEETVMTSTRNPLIVAQHTILNDFAGYRRLYFLGGSLNWANIRGLLSRNIEGLEIHEEGSYASPRVDVWGISDLDLFREASAVLSRQDEPFIAVVQTSGSHRPYTIPKNRGGFVPRQIADAETARNGFDTAAEYNAFRFLDHSLGVFMENAAREPWFPNTIFVLYGDHGLPGNAPNISPGARELELTHFHVPLLFYAPELLGPPRTVDTVASEVDVLPTIASLAGVRCVNSTLGRDLLDPAFDEMRYAYAIGDQEKLPTLWLIGRDRGFSMFGDGSRRRLFRLEGANQQENLVDREPAAAARMEELCRAIHETARYMPYANSPEKVRAQLPQ